MSEVVGGTITELPVNEIIMQQNLSSGYNRMDIFVRYLAIENEYGRNNYGWELYQKMQDLREVKRESINRFKQLIHSYEEKGYSCDSCITLDKRLRLIDGSHRLALALYYKQKTITCKVLSDSKDVDYSIGWFISKDFSNQELNIIIAKKNQLIDVCVGFISLILWPPCSSYYDDISHRISLMADIVHSEDIVFPNESKVFERFVSAVYSIDDIETWKVRKKLEHLPDQGMQSKIRYMELRFDHPKYRLKSKTNQSILTQGEKIKKAIRNLYSNKIDNYYYDIICHSADNTIHSDYIHNLVFPTFSLQELFLLYSDFCWCILKKESEYMTVDFPKTFPFGKDLDIIVHNKDYQAFFNVTYAYLYSKVKGHYELITQVNKEGHHLRVEFKGHLIYQFDIKHEIVGVSETLIKEILSNRVSVMSYYIPTIEDEICIRVNEYIQFGKKKHLDYVRKNSAFINEEKVRNYIANSEEVINSLKNELIHK